MQPNINPYGPNPEPTPEPPKKDTWRTALSTIGILVTAFFVAFLIMFFVFRSYQVEGPSMNPTLHNDDRLIIWKFPRTWARITGETYIPNRGDVIVFAERGLTTPDGDTKQLIKRVIGLPGDRVVVKDGEVRVYNNANPDGFEPDTSMDYGKGLTLGTNPEEEVDETVGNNEVFVMGDNRDNSLDSRTFGPINADDIVGKLVLRMFPVDKAERF